MFWIILAAIALLLAYIRLAPSDAARWHVPVKGAESRSFTAGALVVQAGDADALATLDKAARALPRTSVLAGAVAEGRITYITRSALFGFPDYTTIELDGDMVKAYARLRFGRSDLGVNGARLRQLFAALR